MTPLISLVCGQIWLIFLRSPARVRPGISPAVWILPPRIKAKYVPKKRKEKKSVEFYKANA
jgi:hypothetical protein